MSASEQPDSRADGLRVLLVEDEILVALLLEDMLGELGHTVVGPVPRLDKALEMARSERFDLAFLDVNLDGEQVYPVAEALAARGIPFVFGRATPGRACAPPYGNRPTLQKPFRRHDLRKLLAACRAKRD